MIVTRTSPVTGKVNEKDLPVTYYQFIDWESGALVQDVFHNLSEDDREFILTGMTPEDWDYLFGEEEGV
jgi:hypothetical protein